MTPISFCIPTRNNYKYVKFAYDNIRRCWPKDTELILLDDFSSDETWNWMNEIKKTDSFIKIYRHTGPTRIGHCVLYDIGAQMSSNEIFGIFHADMIPTKNYIENILKHIKPGIIVSGTRIEPLLHPPGPEKISMDFGLEPENFELENFNNTVNKLESENENKITSGIFAPWTCFKKDFQKIGGHDKRVFAPMELEDSDLFNRFLLAGYTFVQARDAFVYHLTCRGSRFKDGVQIQMEIPVGGGKVWKRAKDSDEYTSLRQIKFREWWRKWHMDVLHDEMMMPKICKRYDIGLILHGCTTPQRSILIKHLEPWFDTVYSDLPQFLIDQYVKMEEETSHFNIKNKMKNISDEKTNNILVEFNAQNWKDSHWNIIQNLMFIIEDSGEIGEFEYDTFKFTIKSLESYENNLINADDPWYINKLNVSNVLTNQ